MKLALLILTSALTFSASSAHSQTTRPIPRGIREADQAEAQTERNIPPPLHPPTTVDMTKLSQDADELARIAQTVPSDLASIQKGMLPKDFVQKLKQIERLSKRLRSALDR